WADPTRAGEVARPSRHHRRYADGPGGKLARQAALGRGGATAVVRAFLLRGRHVFLQSVRHLRGIAVPYQGAAHELLRAAARDRRRVPGPDPRGAGQRSALPARAAYDELRPHSSVRRGWRHGVWPVHTHLGWVEGREEELEG